MKLKCQKCGREWDYKGHKRFYTTCPDCKTSVKLKVLKGGKLRNETRRKARD